MGGNLNALTEGEISRRLSKVSGRLEISPFPPDFMPGPPRPAAVLIPFLRFNDAWHLLFTRRLETLPEHSGQVAFPGGRADPEDQDVETTALREANEEIGLKKDDVRILGRLYQFDTITNYRVTPVVGVIPWPYPLQVAREEVARVFTIPLEWLADPVNREEQMRNLPPPLGPAPVIIFRPYDGETLWGVSAAFTLALLEILQGDR